jgi:hypothetical protein
MWIMSMTSKGRILTFIVLQAKNFGALKEKIVKRIEKKN